MNNWTDRFVDYLFRLSKQDFDKHDLHSAKRCLLDYLAVVNAGTILTGNKGVKLVESTPNAEYGVKVVGYSNKKSIDTAAFINGFNAHVAELDDGVNSGIVHPGTPLISALLPVAEFRKVKGQDLLRGIIVGYETTIRMANAIQPYHKKKGYHATGTVGSIGATIGLMAMLGLPQTIWKNAFSASCISAGGTLKALENNSELKPYNVANAASTAINAYLTADAGFEGPDDVLFGEKGFLSLMTDHVEYSQLIPQTNTLAIKSIYVKPYAACRYCHPAIEAAINLRNSNSHRTDEIAKVKVETYDLAVKNHDHADVDSVSSAKMSIPFSVAVSLTNGKAGLADFSQESIIDSQIKALMQKTIVKSDNDFSKLFPSKSLARVTLELTNGNRLFELVEYPKGEPHNPLSDLELEKKFGELLTFAGKSEAQIDGIKNVIRDAEFNLDKLFSLI